jgi:hypothetical protein
MAEATLTLRELLWGTDVTAGIASSVGFAIEKAGAFKAVAAAPVQSIINEAAQALGEALDISLGELLAKAWVDSRSILEAADPGLHRPDETVLVPLVEHSIHSQHKPTLEFTINGGAVCSIEFVVDLSLELQEVVLHIRGGRIRKVVGGSCHAQAALLCEGVELVRRETPDLALPLSVDLGEGVPIPTHRHAATAPPSVAIHRSN